MFDPWSDELISELHFYAPPPSCSSSAPPFWEGGGEQRPTDLRKRKGIKVTITTANHTKVGLKRQKGGRDPEIADSRVAEQRHKKFWHRNPGGGGGGPSSKTSAEKGRRPCLPKKNGCAGREREWGGRNSRGGGGREQQCPDISGDGGCGR